MGTHRTTFLIDEAGIIRHVLRRPNVEAHSPEIQEIFRRSEAE
jgi:peroxiredoxin